MRSGLRHTETGEPAYDADTVRMLFLQGRDDMAAWAEAQPLEAEPGSEFEYSTSTSVILADIAARVLTSRTDAESRRLAVDNFLKARLFGPLAMYSTLPEYDAAGTFIGGSMVHAHDPRLGKVWRIPAQWRSGQGCRSWFPRAGSTS